MTDFYTVLRNALDRVGAVESDERDRVYSHVRDVMVRKLRNHRPPVGETEIESRISTFDAAIDRIESELLEEREEAERQQAAELARQQAAELARERAPERPPAARRPDPRRRNEPVPVPAWEETAGRADGGRVGWGDAAPSPEPMWGAPAIDMAWDETSAQWHDARRVGPAVPVEEALEAADDRPARRRRGLGLGLRRRGKTQSPADGIDDAPADWSVAPKRGRSEDDGAGRPAGARRWFPLARRRRANGADDGLSEPSFEEPSPLRNGGGTARRERRRDAHDPIAELAGRLDARGVTAARAEPLLLAPPAARAEEGLYLPSPEQVVPIAEDPLPRRRRRRKPDESIEDITGEEPSRRRGRRRPLEEPAADADIAGEEERPRRRSRRKAARERAAREEFAGEEAAAETPQRRRSTLAAGLLVLFGVAVIAWAGYVLLQVLGSPDTPVAENVTAPAAATPAAPTETIIVFQGTDPTVFEAAADNPVHYQGDAAGGFVRIGSSMLSGDVRAIIGPGIANRLAGRQIRVIIEARGSPGQPATAVWLAYQRGLAVLERRIQPLSGDFTLLSPAWVIPAGATTGNDYLLIAPGVPGDGTTIDIRSIRIEILN